jgi:hypothetical protein
MLADCASLKPINTRLRPATALAAAWGRKRLADQATITRVLDAFTPGSVAQLRTAVERIDVREGRAMHQPFDRELLFLDIDRTGYRLAVTRKPALRATSAGKKPPWAPARSGQRPSVP